MLLVFEVPHNPILDLYDSQIPAGNDTSGLLVVNLWFSVGGPFGSFPTPRRSLFASSEILRMSWNDPIFDHPAGGFTGSFPFISITFRPKRIDLLTF